MPDLHAASNRLAGKMIVLLTITLSAFFFLKYGTRSATFYGDALGYYLYLPETFIYHNLDKATALPADKDLPPGVINYTHEAERDWKAPNGSVVDQYTYGVALMELPFFLVAHCYEKATHASANGFSETYSMAIKISGIIYALLGLMLVYRILKIYFPNIHSLIGTVALFAGTNLFWFALVQAGMSHVPLFFLYALLVYLTILAGNRPGIALFVAIGLICGLITIIRPTDLLCVFIPLLYNVYDRETLRKKITFIKANKGNILAMTIAFIIPAIPQLIYWKALTGHFLYYSYGAQSFNWKHPKIIDGLFYFSNGWLPYAPIMIFSLAGLLMYRRYKSWAWCLWAILPLYIYVIYAWYCYRYINGLGSRPMIHLYPLLVIPLTAFIEWVGKQKIIIKVSFAVICLLFVAINICYSIQQTMGVLWSEESNMQYNLGMLFRTHLRYSDLVTYDIAEWQPDTARLQKIAVLGYEPFDDSLSDHYVRENVLGGRHMYEMRDQEIQETILLHYNKGQFAGAKWFKCSGWFMYPRQADYKKHMLVLDIQNKLWRGCKIENKVGDWANPSEHTTLFYQKPGTWSYISFFVKVPHNLKDSDPIKMFVWSTARQNLFMDDLRLELYK